jgi:hypothetical protein
MSFQEKTSSRNDKATMIRRRRDLLMRDEEETTEKKKAAQASSIKIQPKIQRQENDDKDKTEKKSPTKEKITKKQENTKTDLQGKKNDTENKKLVIDNKEKNTENKGKELKKEKNKKNKTGNKAGKKTKKSEKGSKKGKGKKENTFKRQPDLSDLVLNAENRIPDLSWIRTTSDLRTFAAGEKSAIGNYLTNEELKLNLRVAKNQKIVDDEYDLQTKQIDSAFGSAILRIAKALTDAKTQADQLKKQKLAQLKKYELEKNKAVDITVTEKQTKLTELGESYAKEAVQHADGIRTDSEDLRGKQKSGIEKDAEDAVNPYAKHEKLEHIVEEVGNLANEMKGQIDDTTNSLQEGVTTDSNDLAKKFRDDAKTTSDGLPGGKAEVQKQIKAIYDQGLLQFDGVSKKPLADLETSLTKMSQDLVLGRKQTLAALAENKRQCNTQIQSNKRESLSGLQLARQRTTASIDQELNDTDRKILEPNANQQQIIFSAADRIAQSVFPLKKGLNDFLIGQSDSLQRRTAECENGIRNAGTASVLSANQTAASAEKSATDMITRISGMYDSIIKKLTESMQDVVKKFGDSLEKTIQDQKTKWDGDLKDGKEAMTKKQTDAYEKNNEIVLGSKEQLVEKAEDASALTWGDFWMGVLGVIVGIVIAIVAIVLIVLFIVYALPFLASFLVYMISVFCGEAFALLVTMLAEWLVAEIALLLAPIMAELMGALFIWGVKTIIDDIRETNSNKGMSSFEKGAHYGFDAVNLIVSFLPFTKVKIPGTMGALLGLGGEEAPTVKGLFGKFWARTPKPKPSVYSGVRSQPFAEFEESYLYQPRTSEGMANSAQYLDMKNFYLTAQETNPLVESLKSTGKLPNYYVDKTAAMSRGWAPGKALNNFVPGGQLGGDIFANTTNILPVSSGRVWFEADIGLLNTMSRAKQAGTRLLYSNDGLMYISWDHYETAVYLGRYK